MNKRIMVVNVYFAPNSFGGATVIAEEMTQRLVEQHGWSASAFASMRTPSLPDFSIRRYRAKSADVVAVNLPGGFNYTELYHSPRVKSKFIEALDAFQPDVVHIHCIQMLGSDLLDAIQERNIPFALTLHDCWWLCDRQFMIDGNGQYCFQEKISPDRCRFCVDDYQASQIRADYLSKQLAKADLLLYPSQFQKDLYLANGAPAERSVVNKNGVRPPKPNFTPRNTPGKPVFGFIGGPGAIKGGDQLVAALRDLNREDIHVKVVDAAQNVGTTWRNEEYWDVPGKLEFVPAYNQNTIDDFFSSIDVLLFPSQWKESFGLTVREALLRDVWIIATEAGGVVEDLRIGVNATGIPLDGRMEPLAAAIEECLQRPNWAEYRNPHKADITTLDNQATELSGLLMSLLQN